MVNLLVKFSFSIQLACTRPLSGSTFFCQCSWVVSFSLLIVQLFADLFPVRAWISYSSSHTCCFCHAAAVLTDFAWRLLTWQHTCLLWWWCWQIQCFTSCPTANVSCLWYSAYDCSMSALSRFRSGCLSGAGALVTLARLPIPQCSLLFFFQYCTSTL